MFFLEPIGCDGKEGEQEKSGPAVFQGVKKRGVAGEGAAGDDGLCLRGELGVSPSGASEGAFPRWAGREFDRVGIEREPEGGRAVGVKDGRDDFVLASEEEVGDVVGIGLFPIASAMKRILQGFAVEKN